VWVAAARTGLSVGSGIYVDVRTSMRSERWPVAGIVAAPRGSPAILDLGVPEDSTQGSAREQKGGGVMTRSAPAPEQEKLMPVERKAAGGVAFVLLGAALALLVFPPARRVALANCANAPTGCVVSVDSDMTTLATALAAAGTVVALIAILGLRFNKVEAQYDAETGGLAEVGRQDRTPSPEPIPASGSPVTSPTSPVALTATPEADDARVPVTVEIVRGLDKQ
jgi:hypothetical protein